MRGPRTPGRAGPGHGGRCCVRAVACRLVHGQLCETLACRCKALGPAAKLCQRSVVAPQRLRLQIRWHPQPRGQALRQIVTPGPHLLRPGAELGLDLCHLRHAGFDVTQAPALAQALLQPAGDDALQARFGVRLRVQADGPRQCQLASAVVRAAAALGRRLLLDAELLLEGLDSAF